MANVIARYRLPPCPPSSRDTTSMVRAIAGALKVRTEAVDLRFYQGDGDDPAEWAVQVAPKTIKTRSGLKTLRRELKVYGATLEEALEAALQAAPFIHREAETIHRARYGVTGS